MSLIETITFRLRDEVDDREFAAANNLFQTEFAYQQPGLVRRTVALGTDGIWIAITVWATLEAAEAADLSFAASTLPTDLSTLIDDTSVEVRRYVTLD